MEFCHVGHADLELLTSGDPPDSTSQGAGITGVSHRAWPSSCFSMSFPFYKGHPSFTSKQASLLTQRFSRCLEAPFPHAHPVIRSLAHPLVPPADVSPAPLMCQEHSRSKTKSSTHPRSQRFRERNRL